MASLSGDAARLKPLISNLDATTKVYIDHLQQAGRWNDSFDRDEGLFLIFGLAGRMLFGN